MFLKFLKQISVCFAVYEKFVYTETKKGNQKP